MRTATIQTRINPKVKAEAQKIWILIYQASEDTVILARTGSHSELFKN